MKSEKITERQKELKRRLTEEAMLNSPVASVNECTGISPANSSGDKEARRRKDIWPATEGIRKKRR